MSNKNLKIYLAAPRGFCAGVDRAIEIVKKSIDKFGAPVYVRHEIVHNKHVVEGLKKIGAIFVEELDEIKDKSRPVIFSAHGVPKSVPEEASNLNMTFVDATCPLVSKGFIISSVGSFWAMFGSLFFFIACIIFLIPFFKKDENE